MELYFEIRPELELNGLQEIHSQHLKLLITKAFFSFSFFKSDIRKFEFSKVTFKNMFYFSL